jgi:hypothetical protein
MKISDIFVVKTGQRITEEEVYLNQGDFPCVTSQTSNNGITWYANKDWLAKEHGQAIIEVDECITWTKDGAKCGTLFYRDYPFYPNDHCGVLILKDEYKDSINLKWFIYTKQELIKGFVSQQGSQGMLYNTEMSEIEIEDWIPDREEIQDKYVEQYEKAIFIKKKALVEINKLKQLLKFEIIPQRYNSLVVGTLYNIIRGNVISEEDIYNNYDELGIPVYSSQTANNGCMGTVNIGLYNLSDKKGEPNTITWTTDGANAGRVFYRENNYLFTNVCGKLDLKIDYANLINNKFIAYELNALSPNYINAQESNPKLMSNQMEEIIVKIPINKHGEIDLSAQNEIAEKYENIEKMIKCLEGILLKIELIVK